MRRDILPRIDRENKHVGIAWLRPDPSALQYLLRHFEKLSSSPVLIYEELRLDIEAQGVGWVLLD